MPHFVSLRSVGVTTNASLRLPRLLLMISATAVALLGLRVAGTAVFTSTSAAAQALKPTVPFPSPVVEALSQAVEAERKQRGIPGLSVAVDHDGSRWTQGFGLADLENQVPATSRTIYRLASISKPVTAVAVMQLVEQGKIDLDAPIQTYVKAFPPKPHTITTRQLLAHMGGIRHYRNDEIASTRRYRNVVDALAIFRDDPLAVEPGTRFLYSTYGYSLLGAAVQEVSGEPFVEYLKRHIFAPAGMTAIRDDDALAIIPNRAAGYRKLRTGELVNSILADVSNKIPGGGLCATAEDLVRFAVAFESDMLVSAKTRREMTTVQKTRDGKPAAYGLGWGLARKSGEPFEVTHTGAQPRVSTILYTRPDDRVRIAIMANLEGVDLLPLSRALARIVLSETRPDAG